MRWKNYHAFSCYMSKLFWLVYRISPIKTWSREKKLCAKRFRKCKSYYFIRPSLTLAARGCFTKLNINHKTSNTMISSTKITTCVAFFIFISLSMCGAIILPTSANFTKRKTVATSVKTIQPVSKIQCVEKCLEEGQKGRCIIAGYNRATKVCHLSLDRRQDVIDVNDETFGVFFINDGKWRLRNIGVLTLLEIR